MFWMMVGLAAAATDESVAVQAAKWAKKATPVAVCTTADECDKKWAKARDWIRDASRFKIAVDERNLLSTPGAIYANTDLSFTMTKVERSDGRFELRVRAWCGNVISCSPKPADAVERLKVILAE
jgi:hypothetical protein